MEKLYTRLVIVFDPLFYFFLSEVEIKREFVLILMHVHALNYVFCLTFNNYGI